MWEDDRPICDRLEDRFGYDNIARNLVEMLVQRKSSDNLVVGIEGDWGTGKTSLLNLIRTRLKNVASEKLMVATFEPWIHSGHQDLVLRFFDELARALGKSTDSKVSKVANLMENIKGCLRPIRLVPGAATAWDLLEELSEQLSALKHQAESNAKDLQLQRRLAKEALLSSDLKLVVFIDDIDRLGKLEILEVFRTIKAVADFPNVTYVLAYDTERVSKALEDFGGLGYLEKIVQVPFSLPELRLEDLSLAVSSMLNELLSAFAPLSDRSQRLLSALTDLVCLVGCNLRGVKRIVNQLRARLLMKPVGLDPVGFLVVQAIVSLVPSQARVFQDSVEGAIDRRQNRLNYFFNSDASPDKLLANLLQTYPASIQAPVSALISVLYGSRTTSHSEGMEIILPNDQVYYSAFFTLRMPPGFESSMARDEFWSRCALGVEECMRVFHEMAAAPATLAYYLEVALRHKFYSMPSTTRINLFVTILSLCDTLHRPLESVSSPLSLQSGVKTMMESAKLLLPEVLELLSLKEVGQLAAATASFGLLPWLTERALEYMPSNPSLGSKLQKFAKANVDVIRTALRKDLLSPSTPVLHSVLLWYRGKSKDGAERAWLRRRLRVQEEFAALAHSFTIDSTTVSGEDKGAVRRQSQFFVLANLLEMDSELLRKKARKAVRTKGDEQMGPELFWLRKLADWDGKLDGIYASD